MFETATSLRHLIEQRYDEDTGTLTLDTSLGDQVTNLLVMLNMPEIVLRGATLTPPKGTLPMPTQSSLSGTVTLWDTPQSQLQIVISPGPQDVAKVYVTSTVPAITLPTLARYVLPLNADAVPGLDAIQFTGGKLLAAQPDGTMVFSAVLEDGWSPFGLSQVHLEQLQFKMAVCADPTWGQAYRVLFTANLMLGSTAIPIEIEVPLGAGSWSLGIVPPGVTINVLDDVAQLLGGSDYQNALPARLAQMTTLQLKQLRLQFDPSDPNWSAIDLDFATANSWPIASNIQIEQVGLALNVRPGNVPMVNGSVYGSFQVSMLQFAVSIPVPLTGTVQLSGRTLQPLPGFGALASLVDAPFAASLPDGIARLGALQINQMWLDYDLNASAISSLGIAVASNGPWTLIPNYLDLDNLEFRIAAQKLSGGWYIQGAASGTILVAGIRVGVAVQGESGSWAVGLNEPLRLPGIGQLGQLVGGDDLATVLPSGIDASVGALTIYRYDMVFGGGSNTLQRLALSFGTSNAWKFWDPYFVLDALSVTINVTNPAGTRALDASIYGVVTIGGVDIVLSAQHPATGTSWTFVGGLGADQELAVGDLIAYLLSNFHVNTPAAVQSFELTELTVTFVTGTRAFTYHCAGQFEMARKTVSLTLDFGVNPQGTDGFTLDVTGDLMIGLAHFKITFDRTPGKAVLTAQWDEKNDPVGFADIAQMFGFTPPPIPEDLDLSLVGAGFSYDFSAGTLVLNAQSQHYGQLLFVTQMVNNQRIYLLDFDVPVNLTLADLPVVGAQLPKTLYIGVKSVALTYVSAALGAQEISNINQTVAAIGATPLLPSTLAPGMTFSALLQLGAEQQTLVLPLSSTPQNQPQPAASAAFAAPALLVAAPTTPSGTTYQGIVKWFKVGKSFGPVQIDRVGVQYQNATLSFLLDAALTVDGLTISLMDLGVGSPLSHFQPTFTLRGLDIEYASGPVEVGGTFLRYTRPENGTTYDEYEGAALLKTEALTLSAFGAYAYYEGHPSLFIYAVLDYPIGGPPFFFVTGLAAGFGYNRALHIPGVDQLAQFPLLTAATFQASAPSGGALVPAGRDGMLAMLQQLEQREAIPPHAGGVFVAIGVRLTSVKLIDSFALLTVTFGTEFEIDLLGLSTLIAPRPEAGKEVPPLAEVQLALKASFIPVQGFLGLAAQLTPASFILSRDCHLTGGYAFYAWFAGPHAGDFVQTLGGYHPRFTPPPHYPLVPRLGLNWQVNSQLAIKGSAYFALTASTLMAGGALQVTWESGRLRAWANASADFLLGWKPFHYAAAVSVDLGVSYTFHFFGTHHISVDVGADLHLWGPEFTGTAHIKLDVVSFTIAFGHGAAPKPKPIAWGGDDTSFTQSFLPPDAVCSVSIAGGLVTSFQPDGAGERPTVWIVNAKDLRLVTNSLIPTKQASLSTGALAHGGTTQFGIAPMDLKASGLVSTQVITITREGEAAEGHFHCEPILKQVPAALWGETMQPGLDQPRFIDNALAGFAITPASAPEPGQTTPVDRSALRYSPERVPDAYGWTGPVAPFTPSGQDDDARKQVIRTQLADSAALTARQALLQALGFDPATVSLQPALVDVFVIPPQVQA